uniref:Uncharacterized protein n=1 Tax=Fagus sylvatica TaxID=28930 RepID=A0A2N9F3Y8_FAGSY
MDLVVVLRKVSVPWTWLSSYGKLCFRRLGCCLTENSVFHRLDCRLMKNFCFVDLVVVLWKIPFHGLGCRPTESFWPHGLGCRPMKGLLFHGLGCRPMDIYMYIFFVIDLIVVLWKFPFPMDLVVALWRISGLMDLVWMMPCMCWKSIDKVGITGEVTVVSPPRRPTIEAGSSIGVGSLSGEVADFLKEFDAKAPNPHPEQYFWSFNGPLVPFGDFWVPNDCSPYLSWLSAGHSDFTKGFKLSIGLGGPMLSLLGSVLAAMDESSLKDVTKTQILAWRSVIQDLMDVGFDLGFMIERLRQTAQCLFGKRIADEIKALQHQIALLQDSLAELTAYQDEMMSTGRMVLRSERSGSFLDSLPD